MVKMITAKGKWKNEVIEKDLYKEECPNPACPTGMLSYPTYMVRPHCPDCKTDLIGGFKGFNDKQPERINYHLEG